VSRFPKHIDPRLIKGSSIPDPTANAVIRKLVPEGDYWLPNELLEQEQALAYAMRLPEHQFRKEYADALADLINACATGHGVLEAARAFAPYGAAMILRRAGGDEEEGFDTTLMHAPLRAEVASDLPKPATVGAACTQNAEMHLLVRGTFGVHRDLVNVAEAARLAGRDRSTIRRWAENGELPGAERTRKGWRIPTAVLLTRARAAS
jgi:excisionase family DNA binding protein